MVVTYSGAKFRHVAVGGCGKLLETLIKKADIGAKLLAQNLQDRIQKSYQLIRC